MRLSSDPGIVFLKWVAIATLYVALELGAELVFGFVVVGIWDALRVPFRDQSHTRPFMSALTLVLLGVSLGALSYLLHRERLFPFTGPRGLSVLLVPPIVGCVMYWYGQWRVHRGRPRLPITTFVGGATFAAAMAVTRYFLFYRQPT
jgi:hypothetical protein